MTLYSINEQIANLETYGVDTETGELLSEEEWKRNMMIYRWKNQTK